MASKEELKNMILQFKVSDLQLLLGFAGQNKGGRKHDLQKKALSLVQNKLSIPLEVKIRQMFRDLIPEMMESKNSTGFMPPNADDRYNYCVNWCSNSPFSNYYTPPDYYGGSSTSNYFSSRRNNYPHYSTRSAEDLSSFKNDFSAKEPFASKPDNQILSELRFKELPFFKYKSDILGVTPLIPMIQKNDLHEFSITYSLNPEQQSYLNRSKKTDKEFRYQVQLRMCVLSGHLETEVSDELPLQLTIKANDKSVQLPPAIPSTNKQGMLLKRMNAPINLSSQTSRKGHTNTLVIDWSVTADKLYGISLNLVKKYTSEELINKLKHKGERDPQITKNYVYNKLGALDEDDDIAATSLKVSLICPLGKIRMSLPVRATTCNHLQCFDGSLYIRMNDVKSVWQCPVCNQPCLYNNLFIDGYFMDVLKSDQFSAKTTEIQIEVDGRWTPLIEKRKNSESNSEKVSKKQKTDHSIAEQKETSLSSTSTDGESSLASLLHNGMGNIDFFECTLSKVKLDRVTPSPPLDEDCSRNKKNVVLVDLTESDSEPEDPNYLPLNLKMPAPSILSENNYSSVPPWLMPKNLYNERDSSPPVFDID